MDVSFGSDCGQDLVCGRSFMYNLFNWRLVITQLLYEWSLMDEWMLLTRLGLSFLRRKKK